jgi:hypothetical protein
MPRTATAPLAAAGGPDCLGAPDRVFLLGLQCQALRYFLDNLHPRGLVLDRQSNHGPRRAHGLCSTSATGMGCIATALASAEPYRLIPPSEARTRLRQCLAHALDALPHEHGVVPHFVHSASGEVVGCDPCSTVETAWLVAGALWAATFLADAELAALAARLYDRVDWAYWAARAGPEAGPLLRHGRGPDGRFLASVWDRLNGETAFMYVLAVGADGGRALPPESWAALRSFHGTVAGLHFNNADLGLFVFQYGLDLLDLSGWVAPGGVDLWAEASVAVAANERACRVAAESFATYRRFWGLSAGDGPADPPDPDTYRVYAPAGLVDGTAHLTATLASVAHRPGPVLDNLREADRDEALAARGRYGFSSVNLDRGWVGRDMIGIDAGAAVLALDNLLQGGRVRAVFHQIPCVRRALDRLHFRPRLLVAG